jgi:hypothetical protein
MPGPLLLPDGTAPVSYSTRSCRRCGGAVRPADGGRGPVWVCASCGRGVRHWSPILSTRR